MRTWILSLLLAGALFYTAIRLFDLQFAAGEVYPEYSTLRTDPKGARLLYDSLAALPGVTVERNYRALEFLPDSGATVLLIAIPAADFGNSSEPYLRVLEDSARRGNRMVAALTLEPDAKLPKFEELAKRWNVQLALDDRVHRHSLYFTNAKGWEPLYRLGAKQMIIERAFGKGSIVLFAGSDDFTNVATVQGGHLNLVTLAIGPNPHIIFDEQHLGIVESGSVVALARRFHLLGIALGLALCAALLLWRNGMDFPPPAFARAATRLTGRTSQAGLVTLLRRHIPPNRLAAACWQEWFHGNRGTLSPPRRQKAESILAGAADRPLEALREIQAVLHAKGELSNLDQFQSAIESAIAGIRKVIIGQDDAIRYSLVVVLCNQHALIEGVPGFAKTLLARTLAAVLGSEFKRIQFTPDLMPADITGTNIFNLQRNEFSLVKGPLFTTFLLADEINRAPAKTQSALLEAMQERTVTIDRESHRLSPNFTVFATQNPIESEGTYPLPEAQKDRFMLKISMSWPTSEDELTLASRSLGEDAPESVLLRGEVGASLSEAELHTLRAVLDTLVVSPQLIEYAVQVVRRTRTDDTILVGAGPRATQSLLRAARAWAAISGRDFVSPDDVRAVAVPVLEHRLILRPESELEGVRATELLDRILHEVPVPR